MATSATAHEPHPGHRPGADTAVRLDGVSRRYDVGGGTLYALHDIDLEVDQGESFCFEPGENE